jgi:hypothetical protein
MRLLSMLLVTAVAVNAQSPLTTIFASNNGNANGGATYFDIDVVDPAGITIFNIDINTSATAAGIEVFTTPTTYVGATVDPSLWTSVAVGTGAGAGIDSPTQVCLSATGGIFLAPGQYGIAIVQDAGTNARYTTGTAPFALSYSTAEATLNLGSGTNSPFTASLFTPRVWNGSLHYESGTTVGNCLPNASSESFGTGCYTEYSSVYEMLAAGPNDLEGMKITSTGGVLSVAAGSGFGVPLGSTAVALGDDDNQPAGTLGMFIGSNGWMAAGAGNSNSFSPSASTLLNNPSTAAYAWTDMNPTASGSGQVYYSESSSGIATATYAGVYGWNTTDPNDIQIKIDTATGDWSIEIEAMGVGNPEATLVGYAVGGASADPGPTDFAQGGAITVTPALHEFMAPGTNDLVGFELVGEQLGGGQISLSLNAGSGFGVPLGATAVTLGDDDVQPVGTLGMFVGSNGFMTDAAGASTAWAPTLAAFLGNPGIGMYSWTDMNPTAAGSGSVYYVESGSLATVIYNGVYGWGTTDPNDIKITCDVSNGNWTMEWESVGAGNPEECLVAYKYGGSTSSTAVDWDGLFAPVPLPTLAAADQLGLALSSNNPAIGTDWDLTCSEMDAAAVGAFFFFGSGASNPGIDLSAIGAPGCFAYTTADLGAFLELGAGSVTHTLAIPNVPALAGAELTVQATSSTPSNAFGINTSNGVTGTLGL